MKFFCLLSICFLLISCSDNGGHSLSLCDSIVIQFKSIASDTIVKTVTTTEPKAIKKIVRFIEEGKSEEFKCSTEGALLFFNKGTITREILFAFSKSRCQHFIWNDEQQVTYDVKMSNEAAAFLQGLAERTNPY